MNLKFQFINHLIASFALSLILLSTPAAQAEKNQDEFNPKPLPDDFVLPMPNGARMVFRPVFLGVGNGPTAEKSFKIGDRTGKEFREELTPVKLTGSFLAKNEGTDDALFYIGKYEVSRAQYSAFLHSDTKSPGGKLSREAQTNITRSEMLTFIGAYNEWLRVNVADKLPAYAGSPGMVRLPNEREWEFAARGGTGVSPDLFEQPVPYSGDVTRYEWFAGPESSHDKLKEIGLLEPNPLGIFDILGNAAEMVQDNYQLQYGHGDSSSYCVRGGSFRTPKGDIRASLRTEQPEFGRDNRPTRDDSIGFRLVIARAQVFTDQNRSGLEASVAKLRADEATAARSKEIESARLTEEKHKLELAAAAAAKSRVDEAERVAAEKTREIETLKLAAENRKADEVKGSMERGRTQGGSSQPSNHQSGMDPNFVFLDMNKIFSSYSKTKEAESRINDARTAAKKELDERMDTYKKNLDEIEQLKNGKGRDEKIAESKNMEREITEFRTAREKQLQDRAISMRNGIVDEITSQVKRLSGTSRNFVMDKSGNSLNGVPIIQRWPDSADESNAISEALKDSPASPFRSHYSSKVGIVDMNRIFSSYYKTKEAESRINDARTAAKKELDERMDTYKKNLDVIKQLEHGTERDEKIAESKNMEREITEFRTAREKQLQDRATSLRNGILDEVLQSNSKCIPSHSDGLIFDISGQSLNGIPIVLFTNNIPDYSDVIIADLNNQSSLNGSAAHVQQPLVESAELRLATVDVNRIFNALPETKRAETEINAAKAAARAFLGRNASSESKAAKDKELNDLAVKKRNSIVKKMEIFISRSANERGLNIVFDISANSLNGVPLIIQAQDIPDLTQDIISLASGSGD